MHIQYPRYIVRKCRELRIVRGAYISILFLLFVAILTLTYMFLECRAPVWDEIQFKSNMIPTPADLHCALKMVKFLGDYCASELFCHSFSCDRYIMEMTSLGRRLSKVGTVCPACGVIPG